MTTMAEYRDISFLNERIAEYRKTISSSNDDYTLGYASALAVIQGIIKSLPMLEEE